MGLGRCVIIALSNEKACVTVPTRDRTVATALIDTPESKNVSQTSCVDDRHVVFVQLVEPRPTDGDESLMPKLAPDTVMLAESKPAGALTLHKEETTGAS